MFRNTRFGAVSPVLIRRRENEVATQNAILWAAALFLGACWLFPGLAQWCLAWLVAAAQR